jgi:hypothetical protein
MFIFTPIARFSFAGLIAPLHIALLALATTTLSAHAERTVLNVSGNLEAKYAEGVEMDLVALQRLPQRTISLKRSWELTPTKFTGPLLRDVLASFKAKGTIVKARSFVDAETQMAVEFSKRVDVIVAYKGTDAAAWLQSNAPLFLVYPQGSADVDGSMVPANNTFQLKSLTVE